MNSLGLMVIMGLLLLTAAATAAPIRLVPRPYQGRPVPVLGMLVFSLVAVAVCYYGALYAYDAAFGP